MNLSKRNVEVNFSIEGQKSDNEKCQCFYPFNLDQIESVEFNSEKESEESVFVVLNDKSTILDITVDNLLCIDIRVSEIIGHKYKMFSLKIDKSHVDFNNYKNNQPTSVDISTMSNFNILKLFYNMILEVIKCCNNLFLFGDNEENARAENLFEHLKATCSDFVASA